MPYNSTNKYYCATLVIFEFHEFPIAFGYLDNSAYKFHCATLIKFESHYHLRFEHRMLVLPRRFAPGIIKGGHYPAPFHFGDSSSNKFQRATRNTRCTHYPATLRFGDSSTYVSDFIPTRRNSSSTSLTKFRLTEAFYDYINQLT
jgi:hypothetical protein